MEAITATIEPAIAYVREQLAACRETPDAVPGNIGGILSAAASVRLYLDIFRPPEYAVCEPGEWLKEHAGDIRNERCSMLVDAVPACTLDPGQAWACLEPLLHGVELYDDAVLVAQLFEEDAIPRILLSLDGPGCFPVRLLVGGVLPMTLETLGERWTVATRGGSIRRKPSGLEFRLKGMREPGPSDERVAQLASKFSELHSTVKAWVRARESDSQPAVALEDAIGQAEAFLALLDGGARAEPADLRRTIEDALSAYAQEAAERSVTIEVFAASQIPPIAVVRRSLIRVWGAIIRHAFCLCARGGRVSFMVDYDGASRRASAMVELDGTQFEPRETVYLASVRRGVGETHGGSAEIAVEEKGMLLTVRLPDLVGKTLDAWLPGWEAFSEQSQQMLRLLKSGGPTFPEEFLLGGILENELERWLLPLLTEPVVINIVHDKEFDLKGLPGASEERLDKVLTQIKRGKVKKESVRPPHAGELLWAFRAPERCRKALRLERLTEDALLELCTGLVRSPVQHLRCLRHIACMAGE